MDKYLDFETLAGNEVLNQDYRIQTRDQGSTITIAAPHGGLIEPQTSLIAENIAGDIFNYYSFEGIKENNNRDLHITSHRFDEPCALSLILRSDIIVTIHACKDKGDLVYIGGRFEELALTIKAAIGRLNIEVKKNKKFSGTHVHNICNKGKLEKGVQLEFSRGLRDNTENLLVISAAIQNVLKHTKY